MDVFACVTPMKSIAQDPCSGPWRFRQGFLAGSIVGVEIGKFGLVAHVGGLHHRFVKIAPRGSSVAVYPSRSRTQGYVCISFHGSTNPAVRCCRWLPP